MPPAAASRASSLAFLAFLFLLAGCDSAVVAEKFDIKHRIEGNKLFVVLDTDLPDFPEVAMTVRRDFKQKNHPIVYAIIYFQEDSTVGAWRKEREIVIDNAEWKKKMEAEHEKYKKMLTPLRVETIDEAIAVKMVIPINQRDKRMGDKNSNLKGKVVEGTSAKLIAREVKVPFPLN